MRFIVALLLMSGTAMAQVQNRTYQDSMGRNTGRSVTDIVATPRLRLDGPQHRPVGHQRAIHDHHLRRRWPGYWPLINRQQRHYHDL